MSAGLTQRARELLSAPNFGVLATIMEDGTPQVSTMWVDLEGDAVIFITTAGATKTRNLRRDPRVAINVTNLENPYEYVTIAGRVRAERTDGGPELIDRLSRKYSGEPYRGHHLNRGWVIFEVEPEQVVHYASELYP
jgi:PPOX class probable F420-dependent enzyme